MLFVNVNYLHITQFKIFLYEKIKITSHKPHWWVSLLMHN